MLLLAWSLLHDLVRVAQEGPEPEDVKAGWVALVVFLVLAVAVALLGISLTRHLRKAQAARDAGVYGDPPAADETGGEQRPPA